MCDMTPSYESKHTCSHCHWHAQGLSLHWGFSYVWHNSFKSVPWLPRMCKITPLSMQYASIIRMSDETAITRLQHALLVRMRVFTWLTCLQATVTLGSVWCETYLFVCVIWILQFCVVVNGYGYIGARLVCNMAIQTCEMSPSNVCSKASSYVA